MTLRARCGGVGAHERETRDAVIEARLVRPGDGIVATRAVGNGERGAGGGVHRVVGGLPIFQVATGVSAIGRLDLQVVVVIDVALRTLRNLPGGSHLVGVGEREARRAVIESGVGPAGGVVASGALRDREAGGDVVRDAPAHRLRAVPLRQVATGIAAVGRRNLQGVIVVDVALDAGRGQVRAGQREPGDAVIKAGHVGPGNGVVTLRAVRRGKGGTSRRVHRVVGGLPILQVAAGVSAIGWLDLQIVVVVDMALRAGHVGVRIAQRETGGGVIERCGGPRSRVVALRAVGGGKDRAGTGMRRIVGLLPGRQMATRVAAIAGGDLQVIVIVDVAFLAGHVGVAGGEREIDRRRRVIAVETGPQPTVKGAVTGLAAVGREIGGILRVRGIAGVLPILQVTGLAVRGKSVENAGSGLLVAILALHRRVRSQQRKPVLVILHLLGGDRPPLHGVTLLAVRTHLPTMHVVFLLVAVGAILAHIREHRLQVTLNAGNLLVHAAQRVVGLVVIEFRNRANRSPARSRVTVLTRNGQRTVGIAGDLFLGDRRYCGTSGGSASY